MASLGEAKRKRPTTADRDALKLTRDARALRLLEVEYECLRQALQYSTKVWLAGFKALRRVLPSASAYVDTLLRANQVHPGVFETLKFEVGKWSDRLFTWLHRKLGRKNDRDRGGYFSR